MESLGILGRGLVVFVCARDVPWMFSGWGHPLNGTVTPIGAHALCVCMLAHATRLAASVIPACAPAGCGGVVGRLTLADLFCIAALFYPLKVALREDQRAEYPLTMRWESRDEGACVWRSPHGRGPGVGGGGE